MKKNTYCSKDNLFYDYMTGTLSPNRRKKMEEHINNCSSCYQSFKIAKELIQDKDGMNYQKASKDEAEEFLKKMDSRAEKKKDKPFLKKMNKILKRLGKKVPAIVEDVILWITVPQAELSYAYVRSFKGDQNISHIFLKKDFDNIQSEIYLQKINDNCFCLDFKVLDQNFENDYIRISLKNIDDDSEISKLLSHEQISFEPLNYGNYELMIKQSNKHIDIFHFEINQEGLHER